MAAIALVLTLAACQDDKAAPPEARFVRVVTVEAGKLANDIQLSGEIQAEKNVGLAFRIAGRVAERPVNVGDNVKAGQLIARLAPTIEQNALTAAKAALEAARGEVSTARSSFARQERLMAQGFTTRPRFDQALKAQEAAQAQLENAEAQVELAQDRLGFTELRAGVAGVVTARNVEPGEVVQPGQVIVQLAREDGRDAVFNVPARSLETQAGDSTVRVALADAPAVSASGRVREIAPQADPVTRTFQVRIGLQDPPEAMRLGSTVIGTLELTSAAIVSIPASALTQQDLSPAVWVVDPAKSTVSLRNIDILRFDPGQVIVSQGLEPGEIIVTGGIQALHVGQRVRPLPPAPEPDRTTAASLTLGHKAKLPS
ncbi:efflux RND transporter periplasmic adaptor subunit [Bosea sp. (in: a-proteobacteria)]|uniref:efflux RND transporter periplasmic adaptor subunit n=1 Tax=Bosea sp. (in: a-proteobacteria) TaxID=1871050 RepID=UPI003F6F475E